MAEPARTRRLAATMTRVVIDSGPAAPTVHLIHSQEYANGGGALLLGSPLNHPRRGDILRRAVSSLTSVWLKLQLLTLVCIGPVCIIAIQTLTWENTVIFAGKCVVLRVPRPNPALPPPRHKLSQQPVNHTIAQSPSCPTGKVQVVL